MVVEHNADSDDEEDHDQEAEGAEQLVEDAANVVVAGSVLLLLCTFFITHGERILDRVLVAAWAVDTVSSIPSTQDRQDGFKLINRAANDPSV